MGIIEFFGIVIGCVVLAWIAVWVLGVLAPGHPATIDHIIWGVAVLIIVVTLARAMGLLGYDPQIPRLR